MASMHIIVVDGFTTNPGDLSWAPLEALGQVRIYDRTSANDVAARCQGARIVLTNKVRFGEEEFARLPDLEYVGVLATGFDIVDVGAARGRGITVTNVPAYSTASVAQHAVALMLELAHRVGHHSLTVHAGRWSMSPDWSYWDYPARELDGLALGVVGYGRIGRAVGRIGLALGMRVLSCTPTPDRSTDDDVAFVELDELFERADIVSLHCPLTDDTRNMVNEYRLGLMKPDAYLINTSRGALIDENALATALRSGLLAGAALDVLTEEPPPEEHPLIGVPNCVVTPHMAWASSASRARLMRVAVDNVKAYLAGNPTNVVR